jgi:hypothetical protein
VTTTIAHGALRGDTCAKRDAGEPLVVGVVTSRTRTESRACEASARDGDAGEATARATTNANVEAVSLTTVDCRPVPDPETTSPATRGDADR